MGKEFDKYCGQCKHYNDWEHTYVKKNKSISACCSYWHTAYHSRNVARRILPSCPGFVSRIKKEYVQLSLF